MNPDTSGQEITVHGLAVDWPLLRKQKLFLLGLAMADEFEAMRDVWNNNNGQEALDGVIELLDYLQDQAAEQLGDTVVFGDDSDDTDGTDDTDEAGGPD